MSVFPQHKYPLRSLNHVHSCPRCCPVDVLRVTCSATTKPRLNQSQTGALTIMGMLQLQFLVLKIEAFQGHHNWPRTICTGQCANNLHALARAITFSVLPIDLLCNDPTIHGFVALCLGCIMFSQQFHAWAHGTKSKLPPLVVVLQDVAVLVSRSQHSAHHRPPYNNNYCIVSGVWNQFLDQHKVFEALEMVLFFKLGVRPRSLSEPSTEWTEDTETASQVAVQ
ncbi:hypothetical protein SLA2020_129770 [Shorea laevis]